MGQYTPNNIITELNRIQAAKINCQEATEELLESNIGRQVPLSHQSTLVGCIPEKGTIIAGLDGSCGTVDNLSCFVYNDKTMNYEILIYNKLNKTWSVPPTGAQVGYSYLILLDWIEINGVKQYYKREAGEYYVPCLEYGLYPRWFNIITQSIDVIFGTVTDYLKLTR